MRVDTTCTEGITLQAVSSQKGQKEATFLINLWGLLSRNESNQSQTSYAEMEAGLDCLRVWKESISFSSLAVKTSVS